MASVTSTYARALTDVVFDQHLGPAKTLQEAQSLAQLVAGSQHRLGSAVPASARFSRATG